MERTATGTFTFLAPAVAAWLCGCVQTPPPTFSDLPPHVLNYAAAPVRADVSPPPARSKPQIQSVKEWEAAGYRPWRHVVVHHSASERGNAEMFDKYHREQRGWDELGYHFVITNGRDGADGKVEVGPRWRTQKWGAHCGGTPNNEYNNYGIGICVVGDFSHRLPSKAQRASLRRLVLYLIRKYSIPPDQVIGHCDAPETQTACPGSALHRYVRETLRPELRRLAAADRR